MVWYDMACENRDNEEKAKTVCSGKSPNFLLFTARRVVVNANEMT